MTAQELIDTAMAKHRITMEELCRRIDWSRSLISQVYNGKREPSPKLLASLERMLRLPAPGEMEPSRKSEGASNSGRIMDPSSGSSVLQTQQKPAQILRLLKRQAEMIDPDQGLSEENMASIGFIEQTLHSIARLIK